MTSPYEMLTVQQMVAAQAGSRPHATAVDDLSYQDLCAAAQLMAARLRESGVPQGAPVAVRLPPGAECVTAQLGILFAGCHFVPVAGSDPLERCIDVLAEVRAAAFIVPASARDEVVSWYQRELGGPVLTVAAAGAGSAPLTTGPSGRPEDVAYVVYTSGSTGKPKGIVQSQRGFAQFIGWMGDEFRMHPGRRIAQWSSPSYDASFCEIFATLTAGGTVYPVPQDIRLDADRLLDWLALHGIHLVQTVPSFARELLHALHQRPDRRPGLELDHLLLAGEALSGDLAAAWSAAVPGLRVINLYGATESILATWLDVDRSWPQSVPIGRAIPGREILVVDAEGKPCEGGAVGEIVVRSRFLTLGYLAADTSSAFTRLRLPDDDEEAAKVPCYRTGDLGRWRDDGLLEFCGRADSQVKLRGMRVELAEIEAALGSHDTVVDCAVVPARGEDGAVESLTAYLVVAADEGSPAVWREHMRRRLSDQVLPSVFITVASLPRNAGGKVDRSQLSDPSAVATAPRVPAPRRRLAEIRSWSARMAASNEPEGRTRS